MYLSMHLGKNNPAGGDLDPDLDPDPDPDPDPSISFHSTLETSLSVPIPRHPSSDVQGFKKCRRAFLSARDQIRRWAALDGTEAEALSPQRENSSSSQTSRAEHVHTGSGSSRSVSHISGSTRSLSHGHNGGQRIMWGGSDNLHTVHTYIHTYMHAQPFALPLPLPLQQTRITSHRIAGTGTSPHHKVLC
jgi:hypothetical protein